MRHRNPLRARHGARGTGWGLGVVALTLALAFSPLAVSPASAQDQTGEITGRVTDPDNAGLPGVTVTATSEALQGARVAVTGVSGNYKLAFLPPGTYRVTYELDGFSTVVREVKVSAAQVTPSNVALQLGTVEEEIVVTGQQAEISETTTGASTVVQDEVEKLPVRRTLEEAVQLAPGVFATGPGSTEDAPRLTISGAMSFENLFTVNGVVVNENLRGQPLDLFIEDAIEETTTATSGVSAEFGRFTGGVVNAITKSGGNRFSGSLRVNLENEDWESETPLTTSQADETNEVLEGTFGGYILKDHLWFFLAGRDRETSEIDQLPLTNVPFDNGREQTRTEGKLTLSPHQSHTVIGSYLEIDDTTTGSTFGTAIDVNGITNREDPQEILSANYTGILSPSFFVEAQYSDRDFVIAKGSGGVPDLIEGTMLRTRNQPYRFHAPTFCGFCEDETRNNENRLLKGSYFLSTEGLGAHDVVFGYDTFDDQRFSINHQTGSDFTFYTTDILIGADNEIFPVIDPDGPVTPWIRWFAIFNEDLARPTEFTTESYFVNDRWQLGDRWSFNVGVRYDQNDGRDSVGTLVASDSKISPRLGASWDVTGTGDLVLNASYGTYVAAIANSVADSTSSGGAVGDFRWDYNGPAINLDPGCVAAGTCTTSSEALQIIFDWYTGLGGALDLADLDPDAPINALLNLQSIPGATAAVDGTLESPGVDELTVGVTKQLGTKGLVRADLVYRDWNDFYAQRTDLSTGQVDTPNGPADFTLIGNFADGFLSREYTGIHTQFRYRFTDRLTLAGNYTLSKTEGNFDGETGPSGPISSTFLNYPQYRQASWNIPEGDLKTDQRHKVRVWAIYDLLRTDRNRLSVSVLQNFFSGQPYGANAGIDPSDAIANPGYETPPTNVLYHFTDRDDFHTDDVTRTDLSFNYSFLIPARGRELEIFLQPEITNLFAEEAVIDPFGRDDDEGVSVLQAFDPFTEVPVEGVHWQRDSRFGQPLNETDFQDPRTFRFSVGLRF